ncbi:hypothetical protein [Moorena producens]|nr:hypothetical protein [Moorena producens]
MRSQTTVILQPTLRQGQEPSTFNLQPLTFNFKHSTNTIQPIPTAT